MRTLAHRMLILSIAVVLSTSLIEPVFAQQPDTSAASKGAPAPTPTLEARLEELEAQIRVLLRQMEIDKEQAAAAARSAPVVQAARDGFSFRSADGAFRLRLRGYVQSDGRFFLEDDE